MVRKVKTTDKAFNKVRKTTKSSHNEEAWWKVAQEYAKIQRAMIKKLGKIR
jgi:hypothetical protein